MIIEISIAIAALAFVVLVFFLVRTLIELRKTLLQTNKTLSFVEEHVEPLHDEVLKLIINTKNITATVNEQLQAMNPFVETIHDVGNAVHDVSEDLTEKVSRLKGRREDKKIGWTNQIAELLELSAHALNVWQNVKKRKR